MDAMIIANRNGNIACTQGGESMAGLSAAKSKGYVGPGDVGVLDSTAHMLKFIDFQEMYFQNNFSPEFRVKPKPELKNAPVFLSPEDLKKVPEPGKPLSGEDMDQFVLKISDEIARILELERK